MEAEISVIE